MASIYELTGAFEKLWELMEEGLLDDEALIGAFETSAEDLAIKLEGYCKFIKNLDMDSLNALRNSLGVSIQGVLQQFLRLT